MECVLHRHLSYLAKKAQLEHSNADEHTAYVYNSSTGNTPQCVGRGFPFEASSIRNEPEAQWCLLLGTHIPTCVLYN